MCCTRPAENTANFNGCRLLALFLQWRNSHGSQANLARRLAFSRAGTLYIHFRLLLSSGEILPGGKFTLRPSLAFFHIGSVTAWHSSSGRGQPKFVACYTRNGITELSHRAPHIFGWAAITLICYFSTEQNVFLWLVHISGPVVLIWTSCE